MNERANLIAFLAVLATIVGLTIIGKPDAAVLTGLIGVLGTFRPWQPRPPAQPPIAPPGEQS